MNALVILAHPDTNSFNNAIAQTAAEELRNCGANVIFHDLYRENFDPMLPTQEIPKEASPPDSIDRHCRELLDADIAVIVHPNWWGTPPAILKGWVDRVMRCGVAYEFEEDDSGEGVPAALLKKLKSAVVFNTGNTPVEREREAFGDPLERIWKDCIFGLCSTADFYRRYFTVVCTSTLDARQAWLKEVRGVIQTAADNCE